MSSDPSASAPAARVAPQQSTASASRDEFLRWLQAVQSRPMLPAPFAPTHMPSLSAESNIQPTAIVDAPSKISDSLFQVMIDETKFRCEDSLRRDAPVTRRVDKVYHPMM
jgi:hypothetical protein